MPAHVPTKISQRLHRVTDAELTRAPVRIHSILDFDLNATSKGQTVYQPANQRVYARPRGHGLVGQRTEQVHITHCPDLSRLCTLSAQIHFPYSRHPWPLRLFDLIGRDVVGGGVKLNATSCSTLMTLTVTFWHIVSSSPSQTYYGYKTEEAKCACVHHCPSFVRPRLLVYTHYKRTNSGTVCLIGSFVSVSSSP